MRELEPLISRFNQTRFIVLTGGSANELIFEAMQIGARHLLSKKSIETELMGVLGRFIASDSATPTGRGVVYTVLSAGGGCGATTVALNLANELQLHTSRTVLLADLDTSYGALASYLGLEGQFGVADVLSRTRQIDEELIRTTAQSFTNHLHVLLSPANTRTARDAPLQFEALNEFLDGCRRAYSYTVLDAPRHSLDVSARLALGSAMTFIVLQLSVKDIHVARAILRSLIDQGVAPGAVSLVVSRYHRKSVISLPQAKEALGRDSLELVSSDYRHSLESMTYGQPLAEVAPRSPLRKDLRDLALKVLATPAPAVTR
jgi:pilus assembly protein CpaE